eukprot:Skav226126  [mRNA]  locus=scaffold1047:272600:278062:- [translate_table: standard]
MLLPQTWFQRRLAWKRAFMGVRHVATFGASKGYEGSRFVALATFNEAQRHLPSLLPEPKLLIPLEGGAVTGRPFVVPDEGLDCANRSPMARIPKPANRGSRSRGLVCRRLAKGDG